MSYSASIFRKKRLSTVSREKTFFLLSVLITVLSMTGCMEPKGLIYEHTITPYTLAYGKNRRIADKSCRVRFLQIKDPVYTNFSILYGLEKVRNAMAENNIAQVRYADKEKISVFFGALEWRWLIFYGDSEADPLPKTGEKQ